MIEGIKQPFTWLLSHPLVLLWLAIFFLWATITDLRSLKIPNKLNALLAIGNLVIFVLYPLTQGDWQASVQALFAASIGFIVLLIPAVATGFQMAGDIKFIGALGFAFTPISMMAYLGLSIVLNALTNGFLIATKRKAFEQVIPFAPFFTCSFIIFLLLA